MRTTRAISATMISLTAFLASCGPSHQFCDVVRSEIAFAPETAAAVVRTDRGEAEQIKAQNAFWRGNCR
jgi:hypothetical protein